VNQVNQALNQANPLPCGARLEAVMGCPLQTLS